MTGRVVDEKGAGLPGVNVVVRGATSGTQTDADGRYSLVVPENATLIFSFVGFASQEVAVGGRTTVNIALAPDAKTLNEVVVVGYGSQQKREVTGAISSVKGTELVNQASQNPVSSLQGRVAGVQITNSGAPGAAPEIRVRGVGSLGGVSPLYVVDGTMLPQGSDLSFLNQADIASIEVLKDAASASIYGIQAANGVVIVTTKRGQAGGARVTYNGFGGVQRATNTIKMANAQQYAQLYNEKNELTGGSASDNLPLNLPSTDWFKEVTRTATIQNHQLSLGGGTDKVSYTFSGSYLKQQGILQKNDYERITARLQTDFSVSDHIKVGYNATFANADAHDAPGITSSVYPNYTSGPNIFYQAYVAPPVLQPFLPTGRYGDPSLIGTSGLGTFANPRGTLDYFVQRSQAQTLVGSAFASFNFLRYFTLRTTAGLSYGSGRFYNYEKADSLTTVQVYRGNRLFKGTAQNSQLQWENTLAYDRTFGNHHLTALVGTTTLRYRSELVTGSISGVPSGGSAFYYFNLGTPGTANFPPSGNLADLYTVASLFGRVNYAYRGRYLLTASFRRDGASKYSESNRYGNFPSIGVGWVISDEPFMQDGSVFSFLKLRGSYGILGNSQVNNNISVLRVTFSPNYTGFFGRQGGLPYPGASIDQLVPPELRWEKVREADAGVEMRFLGNRLGAEFDYYNRRTIDAVFPVPTLLSPGYTNSGGFLANNASFQNQGIEAALRWDPQTSGDFSYSVGLIGAYNQNKVLSTASGDAPLFAGGLPVAGYRATITRVGAPIGAFYGYKVAGVFQSQQEVDDSAQPGSKPGDLRYQDQNGDGTIDARDFVVLGNPNPRFTYGLNTNFRYKAVDLQLDIQGVGGVELLNALREVRYGNENFTEDFYRNRWHGPGTSNSTPSADLSGRNLDVSSYYIEKGDYIRLRNVQLGYNLPTSVANTLRVQGVRFYANAQNPLTLTKYKGFTPEVGGSPTNAGIDLNVYPLTATYNFGINVSF
ncbi:SusC/RagA family TonB-linked outer membrane protein [Hymenobacter weizhouensis]|uniref:SusC/RagA family TonB-linked outer membrane protein n=1 Tax=Hymenobacter sp. YIM 151500-1 TaxID=2987689 RepID=UPI00222652FF|nr:TonB-dependent receptor [Hymenobacter sp. YIM 151500-1]UYZ64973.1 TonB-dependent receptor [Hymenobacter sp. YIM 151500-1]